MCLDHAKAPAPDTIIQYGTKYSLVFALLTLKPILSAAFTKVFRSFVFYSTGVVPANVWSTVERPGLTPL